MRHTHSTPHDGPACRAGLLAAAGIAAALLLVPPTMAREVAVDPSWHPQASERLVKLPANYLKKSLENDFRRSELGRAIRDIDDEIGFKSKTLSDLQSAVAKADGEVKTELRHQFLAEKRAYIELVARKHALRRKHIKTRQRVLENLLDRIAGDKAEMTPARRQLVDNQAAARQRFEASVPAVDMKLLAGSTAPQSKYAREYSKNLAAMKMLIAAIESHPLNAEPVLDGGRLTKQDYVRQLIADSEAELALVDQEATVLGYMAKLVALDATALAEQVKDSERVDSDVTERTSVASAVGFFVNR